ncbi:MAG: hypothetical protein JOZ57_00780, partial [Abitibacteriaceae bacterium]|nr:hypothetical protein [Abditibacteriaceae bacterium]
SAQQVGAAGQSLQNAGVTTNAPQSADTQAEMQSALDNSTPKGQNSVQPGSRLAAAQEAAKAAPQPSTPTPGMDK